MKKKLICLGICAAVLMLSGCGKKNEPSSLQTGAETDQSSSQITSADTSGADLSAADGTSSPEVTTAPDDTQPEPVITTEPEPVHNYDETEMQALYDKMTQIIYNHPYYSAVLLYSMDGETLYSHNEDAMIPGASLIKLPYVYYCCTQIEKGVHSLDETMTYTPEWWCDGSGVIWKYNYGEVYTIAQLLDYSLRYSDNVAYDMLVYLFGTDEFNEMIADWGYDYITINRWYRFPDLTASFMKTSITKMQERSKDSDLWSMVWTALNESIEVYTRDAIGGDEDIAVKYGSYPDWYHEACYVDGENPYILVIMGGASYYNPDVAFVEGVAECAAEIVELYNS